MACTIHWSTPLSGFIGFQKDSLLPCWEILSWSLFQVTHPNPLLSAQFSLSPCLSVSRSYTRTHTHTHTHTLCSQGALETPGLRGHTPPHPPHSAVVLPRAHLTSGTSREQWKSLPLPSDPWLSGSIRGSGCLYWVQIAAGAADGGKDRGALGGGVRWLPPPGCPV